MVVGYRLWRVVVVMMVVAVQVRVRVRMRVRAHAHSLAGLTRRAGPTKPATPRRECVLQKKKINARSAVQDRSLEHNPCARAPALCALCGHVHIYERRRNRERKEVGAVVT